MAYDERKLCVLCAWRGTCQLKYSMPGGVALHCVEFTRDITLKEPEETVRKRNVVLAGPPGIGKTTMIRRLVERTGLHAAGYSTAVVREGLFRSRIEIQFLAGSTVVLAESKSQPGWVRHGRMFADLHAVETVLVPRLQEAIGSPQTEVLVLDEVGRPQCLSEAFRKQVVDCVTSPRSVLAAVSSEDEDDPFVQALETRSDVTVLRVGYDNRERLLDEVALMLTGVATRKG